MEVNGTSMVPGTKHFANSLNALKYLIKYPAASLTNISLAAVSFTSSLDYCFVPLLLCLRTILKTSAITANITIIMKTKV